MALPTVNIGQIPTGDMAEMEDIRRRQALAQALQAQSMQPVPQMRAGPYVVPTSPMEGVAKLAQALVGRKLATEAKDEQKALAQTVSERRRAALAQMLGGAQGAQSQAMQQFAPLLQSGDPQLEAMATQAMISQAMPKPPKWQATERFNPQTGRPEKVLVNLNDPTQTMPFGGQKAEDINKPFLRGPDGKPMPNPLFQQYEMDKAARGATRVSVNTPVTLSTEKKYGEQFAGQVAKADVDMRDSAIKAPALAERANAIKKILADGNVMTGAAADFRLSFGKAAALAGFGSAKDAAANTETLSTMLAQNTLDAIKSSGLGSGTGFSNADRDFLEKAVGGKITLEAATINRLADLAHRAASKSAERWNTRVKEIPASALEGTGIKTDPVPVPALFDGQQRRRKGDKAPQGVEQDVWDNMTPAERALWQN